MVGAPELYDEGKEEEGREMTPKTWGDNDDGGPPTTAESPHSQSGWAWMREEGDKGRGGEAGAQDVTDTPLTVSRGVLYLSRN